jgi:hypothetical protein
MAADELVERALVAGGKLSDQCLFGLRSHAP